MSDSGMQLPVGLLGEHRNTSFTESSQAASTLPFGHQRMLELARAMAARPQVLLLDEPAAGMNRVEKDALVELLRRIQALGVTLVLVEHDMTVVMGLAEQIVVLDHGAVLAEGAPEEITRNPKVIEAYLGTEVAS